ncbi:MAG TPA: pirin family protein [Burkholderiales bacterium]|nr:pirin family protein [Burkholderiales bacterium]
MLTIRRSAERGRTDLGWLDSRHNFSFADYRDPAHMGISDLRVINEDRVQPGAGFGTHGHRDMEIVSYVLDGALEHKDSLGTGSVIRPGDVQRMSAGTGVRHSEYNHSKAELVHFLQIWIVPNSEGLPPSYEQRHFDDAALRGGLRLIASPDGRRESVTIHQNAFLYAARMDAGGTVNYALADNRSAYVHVARGAVTLNGCPLQAGDGAAARAERSLEVESPEPAELLLFDLR